MGEIRRRPQAQQDILEIWVHIARENLSAGDKVVDRIDRAVSLLSSNKLAGRERPELSLEIRSFSVGSYVLYYRPFSAGVEVVRVLHGRRDVGPDTLG